MSEEEGGAAAAVAGPLEGTVQETFDKMDNQDVVKNSENFRKRNGEGRDVPPSYTASEAATIIEELEEREVFAGTKHEKEYLGLDKSGKLKNLGFKGTALRIIYSLQGSNRKDSVQEKLEYLTEQREGFVALKDEIESALYNNDVNKDGTPIGLHALKSHIEDKMHESGETAKEAKQYMDELFLRKKQVDEELGGLGNKDPTKRKELRVESNEIGQEINYLRNVMMSDGNDFRESKAELNTVKEQATEYDGNLTRIYTAIQDIDRKYHEISSSCPVNRKTYDTDIAIGEAIAGATIDDLGEEATTVINTEGVKIGIVGGMDSGINTDLNLPSRTKPGTSHQDAKSALYDVGLMDEIETTLYSGTQQQQQE